MPPLKGWGAFRFALVFFKIVSEAFNFDTNYCMNLYVKKIMK